jgi:hypothetical protein
MPATAVVPLGPETVNRKWRIDVNDTDNGGTFAVPVWEGVAGVSDFKPGFTPDLVENGDFDSAGAHSKVVTATDWSPTFKVERKVNLLTPTTYNRGQEILRTASYGISIENNVDIRYYEMTPGGPKTEAWRGYAVVGWDEDGGDFTAKSTVSVTLSAAGARSAITHPDGAAVVPVLISVSPAVGVQAGGTLHTLRGVGFFAAGVSAVASMKLGVTNVPKFDVISDNILVFLAPAKAAGQFIVYVTNAVGESITTAVILDIT